MTRIIITALYLHAAGAHLPLQHGPAIVAPHAPAHRTEWVAPGTRLGVAMDRMWSLVQ